MSAKVHCLFCGKKPYAKTELLPFPKDQELVKKWLQKLNVNQSSLNLNLRSAKICLTHYNKATADDPRLISLSEMNKYRRSIKCLKNACIVCTLLTKTITQVDPSKLIPFPRDEFAKKIWSRAFGLDLTKVDHNSAFICRDHYSRLELEQKTNKLFDYSSGGCCLACQIAKVFTDNSNDKKSLVPFPKDEKLRYTWASKLNIPPDSVNKRGASICIDHYKKVQVQQTTVHIKKAIDRETCLVCRYSSEADVNQITLIPFPIDGELRNQWARIFNLPIDFINNKSARICMDHYRHAEVNAPGISNTKKYNSKYTTYKFICLVCGFRPEDPSILMPFPFTKNDQLSKIWAMKFALPVEVINQRNARFCVEHFADGNFELPPLESESVLEQFQMGNSIKEEILSDNEVEPESELLVKIEPEEFSMGNVCIKSEPEFEMKSIVEVQPNSKFEITEIKQETMDDINYGEIFIKTEKQSE